MRAVSWPRDGSSQPVTVDAGKAALFVVAVFCLLPAAAWGQRPGSFSLTNQVPVCDTNPPVGPAVRLNWTSASGATSYEIYRNSTQIASGVTGTTFYNSTGLTAGQSYSYSVRARNSAGTTDSNTISVSIPSNICAGSTPPGSFSLTNQAPVCDTGTPVGPAVRLNWTSASGASSYEVYRNSSQIASGVTGTTFYNSTGLSAGQNYSYFGENWAGENWAGWYRVRLFLGDLGMAE